MKEKILGSLVNFYDKQYKKLTIASLLLVLLALGSIFFQYYTTGDFINRGVSLKGGVTITTPILQDVTSTELQTIASTTFPGKDIAVRTVTQQGKSAGYIIEAELTTNEEIDLLISTITKQYNLKKEYLAIDRMGGSLGASFFKEAFISMLIAFLFMSIAVLAYFRVPIPSLMVIMAAFSDIVCTVAIVNILGIKLSTAGIVAFLLLIGYSVDTDMLLSARVLRKKEGTVLDRTFGAMKTGVMMTLTAIAAVTVALLLSISEQLTQIMTIVLIGLLMDMIFTWIQNAGLLRMYMERKEKKRHE